MKRFAFSDVTNPRSVSGSFPSLSEIIVSFMEERELRKLTSIKVVAIEESVVAYLVDVIVSGEVWLAKN
jgi:hypothetical protein